MEEVIWCWSFEDCDNIIFIFRTLPHKEIKIDLREIFNGVNIENSKLNQNEKELIKYLSTDLNQNNKCKTCKYLLKTQPNKRIMHKCAVTGKDITLAMKACEEFKNN